MQVVLCPLALRRAPQSARCGLTPATQLLSLCLERELALLRASAVSRIIRQPGGFSRSAPSAWQKIGFVLLFQKASGKKPSGGGCLPPGPQGTAQQVLSARGEPPPCSMEVPATAGALRGRSPPHPVAGAPCGIRHKCVPLDQEEGRPRSGLAHTAPDHQDTLPSARRRGFSYAEGGLRELQSGLGARLSRCFLLPQ